MALDAGEIWEIVLKTIKYTLVYMIMVIFIGMQFAVISGYGFFTYSSTNTERFIHCYANSSDYPLAQDSSKTER